MNPTCFRAEDDRLEIEVELIHPETRVSEKVKALLDTGFSGWILVPYDIYRKVSLVEAEEIKAYGTLDGHIRVRVAKCIIKIRNIEIEGYVESPIFGREFTLIGRKLLSKLSVEIKKGKEICISDPI